MCLTGLILALTRLARPGHIGLMGAGLGRALLVGVAQAMAICPGISRSGSTIACGLFLRLERSFAARFSFVLSIPAILGALLMQIMDLEAGQAMTFQPLIVGAAGPQP